jgi:rRNA biogenesis protein RRP5
MEFKHGEPERGRTIFEGIVNSYPKRLDLWNVWLDKEMQQGDAEKVRRLFERVLNLKISSKKAKFFFKKWLQYSKQEDVQSIDLVKQKAMEYVQRMSA